MNDVSQPPPPPTCSCPICYNSLPTSKKALDALYFYDCSHVICRTCKFAWKKNTCPLCRSYLKIVAFHLRTTYHGLPTPFLIFDLAEVDSPKHRNTCRMLCHLLTTIIPDAVFLAYEKDMRPLQNGFSIRFHVPYIRVKHRRKATDTLRHEFDTRIEVLREYYQHNLYPLEQDVFTSIEYISMSFMENFMVLGFVE
jgi:hypothetical protein